MTDTPCSGARGTTTAQRVQQEAGCTQTRGAGGRAAEAALSPSTARAIFDQCNEIKRMAEIDDDTFEVVRRVLFDSDEGRSPLPMLSTAQAGVLLEFMRDILYQASALDSAEEAVARSCGGREPADDGFCTPGIRPARDGIWFDERSPGLAAVEDACLGAGDWLASLLAELRPLQSGVAQALPLSRGGTCPR